MLGAAEESKTFFISGSETTCINKKKKEKQKKEKLVKMEQTQFIYILLSLILKFFM